MPLETKNTKEKYYLPSFSVLINGKQKKNILHLSNIRIIKKICLCVLERWVD